MEDPCVQCDKYDSFLEKNHRQTADPKEPGDSSLLRKTLEQHQQIHLKYKHLVENAPDAVFFADAETGLILEANNKAAELLGIPLDQIIGMHQSQMYPPEDVQKYSNIFQKCAQMESASSVNIAVCNKDGKKIPVQVNTSTVQFNNQKVICGIFRDMTDQKKLQQQLANSERLYRDLYRNAKAALYRTRTSDGKLLMCNIALATLHGYDSIEDCLENHHGTNHYVDKNRRKQLLDKLREDKRVESFEYQIRHPDGKTAWLALTAEIFPEQGWIEGMVTDITASKVLTQTELKILKIILSGKSNKEIAYGLDRSTRTIECHRANIMRKLDVDNVVDLTRKALEYDIIPEGE